MNNDRLPLPDAPIFPVDKRTKRPLTPNGFKNATTDKTQIAVWQEAYPDCGWGMPTGEASGVFVVDLDIKDNGPENWEELTDGGADDTLTVRTQSGGLHLYFQLNGSDIRNSASKIADGIDIRGEGGYVVVPPTD